MVSFKEALKEAKYVNIFTNSAFTYHVQRELGAWVRNGWRTATGGAPKHEDLVKELLELLNQPKQLAVKVVFMPKVPQSTRIFFIKVLHKN